MALYTSNEFKIDLKANAEKKEVLVWCSFSVQRRKNHLESVIPSRGKRNLY